MSRIPQPDPGLDALGILCESMADGSAEPALIRREQAGQVDLCQSTQLPVEGSPGHGGDAEQWARLGVEFGPVLDGEIFRDAKLPPGWSKRPSPDHHMYSHLVDDKGRVRARIFYKAAFYDRSANIHLRHRFDIRQDLSHYDGPSRPEKTPVRFHVLDGGTEIWSTQVEYVEPIEGESKIARLDRADELERTHREAAIAWLAARYPDFEDPCAHWDDP